MWISGKAEKTTDIVPAKYQTANRELAACIIILTDLDVDLDFQPNVQRVGLSHDKPGEWCFYIARGERRIDIYAVGYEPLIVILREVGIPVVHSGDVYRLRLTGDKPIIGSIENVNIVVNTTPNNATIYLNEKIVEDPQKILAPVGKNDIRIELKDYKPIIEQIDVNEKNTFFAYKLELSMSVPVTIETEPAGASIFLNNINCGKTPNTFFYQGGEYRLKLILENYAEVNEVIEIKEPQTIKKYKLDDIRGFLTVKTIPQAKAYINNEYYPQGINNLKLAPQLVQVKVTAPKSQDIIQNVVIEEKKEHLLKLYPVMDTGTIAVNVVPLDAQVTLTGDADEKYSSKGSKTFEEVPIGEYHLEVKAGGYNTYREVLQVKKDELAKKEILLKKGSDLVEVTITSEPPDAKIYVDKKRRGKTPAKLQLYTGERNVVLKKSIYYDTAKTISVSERESDFSFSMDMDEIKFNRSVEFARKLYGFNDFFKEVFIEKDSSGDADQHISNTIFHTAEYISKIGIIYYQNTIVACSPGLLHHTSIFNEVECCSSLNAFYWTFGFFDRLFFGIDKNSFWGWNIGTLGIGYLCTSSDHKMRLFLDSEVFAEILQSYQGLDYFNENVSKIEEHRQYYFNFLKVEANLEIFTGLCCFVVLTGGLRYGGITEKPRYDDTNYYTGAEEGEQIPGYWLDPESVIKKGVQPYFGVGIRF